MSAMLMCPSCGELCAAVPPAEEYKGEPWWVDGQAGTCECGVKVIVNADGERAWLEEVEEDEGVRDA